MATAEDKAQKKAEQQDKQSVKKSLVLKGRKSTKVGKGQRKDEGRNSSS